MLANQSSFSAFKGEDPQVVKHAIRAEQAYAMYGDLHSAATALRFALEGFLRSFVSTEVDPSLVDEGESLVDIINNHWAPRAGYSEMHVIRMLGNKAAHPGHGDPTEAEVRGALESFWRILQDRFDPTASNTSAYRAPRGGTHPAELVQQLEDEQRTIRGLNEKIVELSEKRRIQDDEVALLRAKQGVKEEELDRLNEELRSAEAEAKQGEELLEKVRQLEGQRQALEGECAALAQQAQDDERQRRELDDRLAEADRELASLLEDREWTSGFPADDWSQVDRFVLERLEKGITPFQEWHMKPRLIGEGGFGRVYRCYPSNDGVPVAIKIPWGKRRDAAGLRKAWQGECRSARRVAARFASKTSLTVPKPLQIAPEGIDAFVVYEFVEGPELGEAIEGANSTKEHQRLSTHQALFIADHLAGTVDQLLQLGVRHTDLQPRNVILRSSHEPVLIDYAPCLPGDRRPPEWRGKDPQECETEVVESGQIHLLAILLVQMLGVEPQLQAGLSGSIPFLDADLEPAVPKKVREENLTADLERRLEALQAEARDEIIKLILDALDEDHEPRKGMGIPAFRRILREAYDPSGLIGAIWQPA